jgi:hypothetical protein
MSILLLVVAMMVLVIGVTGHHGVRAARAQWAADAAALAAAGVGPTSLEAESVAREVAEANGATLLTLVIAPESGSDSGVGVGQRQAASPVVVIEVDYGGVIAQAAARRFSTNGS